MRPRQSVACAAIILGILLAPALAACGGSSDDGIERERIEFVNSRGARAILRVEIADTQPEREKGLSGRDRLGESEGMLFVIEQRGPGFWMKDALIPLTVAFVSSCGEIVHLADMEPNTLEIHSTPRDYRFGIEANQGWFEKRGIEVGDKVELPDGIEQPGCT